ncbi:MAG: ABC transporter substrate-binding protein [Candidatus Paceibacterota bacterium]
MKTLLRLCAQALEKFLSFFIRTKHTDAFFKKTRDFILGRYHEISALQGRKRMVFSILLIVFTVTSFGLLIKVNNMFTVSVPSHGGSLKEGVVGAPRFINPLLALSDADRDLTMLIYSGLLRATPEGDLIPDLAEKYSISDDGLSYTFTLKSNLLWHDGKPITSDDVLFTIERVQDSLLKSPKRASWEGVRVEKVDEKTLSFILKRPYSPFLENTTLGILPQHIWEDISTEQFGFSRYNIRPVGSGPYKMVSIKNNRSGIPENYKLSSFKHFALGEPYLKNLIINFYPNEEETIQAFTKQDIEAANAIAFQSVAELRSHNHTILTYILPRVFGVFFNQNQNNLFTNFNIRKALALSTPREAIVDEVLLGYGTPIDGPLPPGSLGFTSNPPEDHNETSEEELLSPKEEAKVLLESAGWKINEETGIRENKGVTLSFSLSTSDTPELKKTGEMLKNAWEEVGVDVDLQVWSVSDLNNNVIRPRRYDALLFGEIIGRESDPFAFWHSSQRNDPGLNIALYTNITTDKLLEKGRETFPKEERTELYEQFQEEIQKDIPAVFVYSPDFVYIVPKKIQGITTGTIAVPSERFLDVHTWYIETQRLWKIFVN